MAENGDADKAKRPATEAGRPRSDPQNEWTASDRRGPLGAAKDEEEDKPDRPHEGETTPATKETFAHDAASDEPSSVAEPHTSEPHASAPHTSAPHTSELPATDPATTEPAPVDPTLGTAHPEQPQSEPLPVEAERRHVPVLPIIAALVVGAVIGAGSAGVIYKASDQGASQSDVNALASRLDSLEKRPDPQPELDGLKASLGKLSTQKTAAPAAPAFDPAPLQQKIAGLAADVESLKKQGADNALGDKVAALSSAIDGLKKEDESAQAGIASLQSGQKSLEGKSGAPALAVAADSLVVAIAQGRPYATQVDALASLGADPTKLAVLRENADKGVPSAHALGAAFAPVADPIIAAASQAPPNAGFGDRLKSGFFGLVSVRRADATSGDDVPSRVSRIEADLAHDDVAGAYETWNGLPAAAKAKSDAWGALAKTHVTAMVAARVLQQQAIAALGGKKS